jgi:hypothetical protein
MGKLENAYVTLVVRCGWKRSIERPARRWEDDIKIDLGEIGWEIVG